MRRRSTAASTASFHAIGSDDVTHSARKPQYRQALPQVDAPSPRLAHRGDRTSASAVARVTQPPHFPRPRLRKRSIGTILETIVPSSPQPRRLQRRSAHVVRLKGVLMCGFHDCQHTPVAGWIPTSGCRSPEFVVTDAKLCDIRRVPLCQHDHHHFAKSSTFRVMSTAIVHHRASACCRAREQ
jgi:hypothetical protein